MNFEKLNSVVASYQGKNSSVVFDDAYREIISLFRDANRAAVVSGGIGSESEADEMLDDLIMSLLAADPVQNFGSRFLRCLKNRRLDLARKTTRRNNRYELTLDSVDDHNHHIVSEDLSAEQQYCETKREDDQRQLIAYLLEKADTTTTAIVEAYYLAPPSASDLQIAKSIGLHHETAKRKLRKLATRYDANRFGNTSDYLAV